jgi:hypothetical protein
MKNVIVFGFGIQVLKSLLIAQALMQVKSLGDGAFHFAEENWGIAPTRKPYVCGVFGRFSVSPEMGHNALWEGVTSKTGYDYFEQVEVNRAGDACAFVTDNSNYSCASVEHYQDDDR